MTTTELQHGIGKAMKRVLRGETIILTSHGESVAQLVPVPKNASIEGGKRAKSGEKTIDAN